MKRIIIDCDPGHDDAVAIFMAMANPEQFKITAITTVCGNNAVEKMTHNARIIATIAGRKPLIAQGISHPLVGDPVLSSEFHGVTGMDGPVNLPELDVDVDSRNAVEVMRDILREAPATIIALGPLTNIAVFLRLYPELKENIEMISMMGGGLDHGNIMAFDKANKFAEFNIYVDPEAAQVVFSSGIPIVMSGLDVTDKLILLSEAYEHLRGCGELAQFFCELMDFSGKSALKFGLKGCAMHDPSATAWLMRPDLFTGIRGRVSVTLSGIERGRTVLAPSDDGNTLALTGADEKAVIKLIIECIEKLCNKN